MKAETVRHAVNYLALAAGYPMDENRMVVFIQQLADLKHEDVFAEAVSRLVKRSEFMPKIAEIRAAYTEVLMTWEFPNALFSGRQDDSAWRHAALSPDYCIECDASRPLGELQRHNGYCVECWNDPERAAKESERLARLRMPTLAQMEAEQ